MQRAEQLFLAPHRGAPVTVEQACRCLGISVRALNRAFSQVRGASPARWARAKRLDLAREALLAAPELPSAVKQAALSNGFRHLGRFALLYRKRFGELPSATRERALAPQRLCSTAA